MFVRIVLGCVLALSACDQGKKTVDKTVEGSAKEPTSAPKPAPAPSAPAVNPWLEPIAADEVACKTDDDCGEVTPACNSCCERSPIAKRHIEAFTARKEKRCASYSGGSCTCEQVAHYDACQNERCTVVNGSRPRPAPMKPPPPRHPGDPDL